MNDLQWDYILHDDLYPHLEESLRNGEFEMNDQQPRFVRINKADHPMHGMIGTISRVLEPDGFTRVRLLNSSVNAYFKPEDLQPIQAGTKVLIEVEISKFFENAMMVAGGWMSLDRIVDIRSRPCDFCGKPTGSPISTICDECFKKEQF